MAFNNMDIDTGKVLFDLCLEQVDRDVGDLIVRVVQEENENRVYADIPDLNEPYDDGSTETPMNDDHSSNSNDSIETSVESSGLPQVVVSVESSGSGLPQDNVQDHTGQRLEKQDIEVEASLEDEEDRRRAYSYLQELHSSFKNSAEEESITEESDEENDSSNEENDSVIDEMYYSCDSDAWDIMPDISDYESCSVDMNSSSEIDGTIWDRVLAKSPDFCVDNKVASEKSTVESDGNEASETEYSVPLNSPEEIKHGDEMSSVWRNPIIISSSLLDSDADINTSIKSDMEDIHLTDDEFEQTWNL